MKRNVFKKIIAALCVTTTVVGLTACDKTNEEVEFYEVTGGTVQSGSLTSQDYTASTYSQKGEILSKLEQYMAETHMGGIPLFENSGLIKYRSDVIKGAPNYIPGFGFGVLSDGEITADLSTEPNADWKRYYHTYTSIETTTVNYYDEMTSSVSDYFTYLVSTYYTTSMNDSKDGYEWVPLLAIGEPQLLDSNGNELTGETATSDTIKIQLRKDVKYSTLSTNSKYAGFNDRDIELEDYLTPYKQMYLQQNELARGSSNLDASTAVSGLTQYYNATANGFNQAAWDKVGVKTSEENGNWYITINLNSKVNRFYAKYYTSSSLMSPLPMDFLDAVGGMKQYGKYSSDNKETPLDTSLSTGSYVIEHFNSGSEVAFKKNPNSPYGADKYKIAGVHFNVLTGAQTDITLPWKEFEAGKLHACSVPAAEKNSQTGQDGVETVPGATTWKLNLNQTTQEQWVDTFGVNGTIAQTQESRYYEVEPAMSNPNFVDGLYHAIDRIQFGENNGFSPTGSVLSGAYMIDPENGISYNSTTDHTNALTAAGRLTDQTDAYGYSITLARRYFTAACNELLASNAYKAGDTIEIEVIVLSAGYVETMGKDIKSYFEAAFEGAHDDLSLNVTITSPNVGESIYDDYMRVGKFDIAMGAIGGNTLDPLGFFDVLLSNNVTGLTNNYGYDTNKVVTNSTDRGYIVYDNKTWSFDGLWYAANSNALLLNGSYAGDAANNIYANVVESLHDEETSTRSVQVTTNYVTGATVNIKTVTLIGKKNGKDVTIELDSDKFTVENQQIKFEISESQEDYFLGLVDIEIEYEITIGGTTKTETHIISTRFVK